MRKYFVLIALILLVGVCGCSDRNVRPAELRPSVLIEIPQTRQATPYTCGVAVVQSLLAYNGVLFRQDVLERRLGATPERGTTPDAIMTCLNEYGIGAVVEQNISLPRLRAYIDAGQPVVCFLQAWNDDPAFDYSTGWEDGHYAVAVGYDADRIYFMDPSTLANYAYIPNGPFLARWHDGDERQQIYQAGIVVTNRQPVYKRDAFVPML